MSSDPQEPKPDAGIMVGELLDEGLVMVQVRSQDSSLAVFITPDKSAQLRRHLERAETIITFAGPAPELKKDG